MRGVVFESLQHPEALFEEALGKEKVEEEWAAGRVEGEAALELESPAGS